MQIQTTKALRAKLPTPKTAVAELDERLASGELPGDLYVQSGEVLKEKSPGALPLSAGSQMARSAKRRVLVSNGVLSTMFGGVGAALGYMALPNAPLLGAVTGVGIGVAFGLDSGREYQGKVQLNLDGEVSSRKWYGSAGSFEKTPQELRTILHSKGVLGDRIEAVPFPALEAPVDAAKLAALKPHKGRLKELAEQRRLLADFGSESRYGQPALQMIDLGQARALLSRGKPVQVVSVAELKDTPHQLTTQAQSGTHHSKTISSHHYLEREFSYQLQAIHQASELAQVKEGKGLPESAIGVPRDQTSFKQTVYSRQESGGRVITKESDQSHESLREALLGPAPDTKKAPQATSALKNMVNPSTRGYAIAGGILGVAAGAAIPGLEPAVGVTLGAFAGHFVGRAAVSRTAENRTESKTLRTVAKGLGAAAGLGLGLLAASQTGQHALVACGFVGAIGGLSSGALLGRQMKSSQVGNMALGGLSAGGLLGIYASAAGAGPIATAALGALGAVAGGCVASLATRGKI